MTERRRSGPVLVVDDHPLSCRLLERILDFEGYTTLVASSIAEAEALVRETVPSLIVVDIRLPDGSGLDLARRLKLEPATWRCTVLACSAGATAGERTRALQAGCDDYVAKPVEIGSFIRLVSKFAAPDHDRRAPAAGGVRRAPLPKAL
ncbi:MAG TPA: response regulator [Solirubrobacteraceae bacterium]|jgi:CheY-like chemotaxis protein